MSAPATDEVERARLYWRCRRGMLELDLLLQGFVTGPGYDALTAAQRQIFHELLEAADQELLELLLGQQEPESNAVADVIAAIRRAA